MAAAALLRRRRRWLPWLALAVAAGVGIGVWQIQAGGSATESPPTATARRGDVTVSVGGVGRIVEGGASGLIALPAATAGGGTASGGTAGGASASPDAVFPLTSGRVVRLLVEPGQRVKAGAPLAELDDGGSAATAVTQAENDLAVAKLELFQKRTHDPLNGVPATPAELAAGNLAVTSAREQLARLLGPSLPADVSAARLELRRAEADLEALRGGPPGARARAIRIAKENVGLAQARLDRVLAPASPAEVSAAQAEVKKAEADLADLRRPKADQPPASPEAIAAAQAALDAARLKLAQLLAPPDPADVSEARVELDRAKAELSALEAGPSPAALAAARQAVDAARARLNQLLGPPLSSDVTAARLEVRRAEAELAVLRARGAPASTTDVELAHLKVAAARASLALARALERQLTVRAPAAGTVTALLTVPGAPVDPTTPVATVADLRQLAVHIDLSEFDAAQVKEGLRAIVRVDALGGTSFPGTVTFVGLTGVDTGGLVTFPVQIALEKAAGLKPGMNASVRIIVAQRRNVVHVPLEAISRDEEDNPIVEVVDESGKTSTRRVTLGLADNKDVEITSGLRAGERVVLAGEQGD